MPEPTGLARLFQEYSTLAGQDRRRQTADQARSLQYFHDEMASSGDGSAPRARTIRWVYTVKSVDAFVTSAGHLPRENNRLPKLEIDPREQALADWIRYQRRPASRALHCEYQRRRLECLLGFSWDPLGDQWDAQFAQFTRFVGEFHRAPRYRAEDATERTIAAWAAKQRHFLRSGTLPEDRVRKLRNLAFGLASKQRK